MLSKATQIGTIALFALLTACASAPPAATAAASETGATSAAATAAANTAATPAPAAAPGADDKKAPPGQTKYKWTKANEAEVTAALDEKFREAAKAFVQVKRDDQLMFCKRYKEMGSSIRTLHCITEAELRKQVEDSDELRSQMRNKMGKCDIAVGCSAGF
ncbi:MAG TPA: hypothetical protein VMF52_14180 [Steroidobacteraceae bacterium]|nr:hypothetical protein [Steroidobacteraceae bacterium]